MKFNFTKLQGTGNDFVLIDCLKEPKLDYIGAAKALCDRHYGIGALPAMFTKRVLCPKRNSPWRPGQGFWFRR